MAHEVADPALFADNEQFGLASLDCFALFSKYILTSKGGKEIDETDNPQIICVGNMLFSSSKDSGDLSITFYQTTTNREQEFNSNKTIEGNYQVKFHLIDVSGFALLSTRKKVHKEKDKMWT